MGVPGSANFLLAGAQGYQIERSLRFNSGDSAYLSQGTSRSPAADTSITFSFWLKLGSLTTDQQIIWSNPAAGYLYIVYWGSYASGGLWVGNDAPGNDANAAKSNGVLRDPSAWYHIVYSRAHSSNGILYINGVQQTTQAINTANVDFFADSTRSIGRRSNGTRYGDYYLADFFCIDGQALTPSSFGETDTITGVWKPKKYAGTYGTNGFYLKFADNSGTTSTTLGKDSSGNGNNWTPNNFSVTAGAGNDSLIDTPTPYADGGNGRGNYCTWNPLSTIAFALANGNLDVTGSTTSNRIAKSTFAVSSGKWYWEITNTALTASNATLGICSDSATYSTGVLATGSDVLYYGLNGNKYVNGSSSAYGASFTTNDVIGIALDLNANTVTFYKNNTSQGSISITAGITWVACWVGQGSTADAATANFGQRAFAYTPPSGFLALNTQNLPEPTIKKPSSYIDVLTYTGDGNATKTITGLGFNPDLVWIKNRNLTNPHAWFDSVRGVNKFLTSNSTNAEENPGLYGYVSAFNSDGFTLTTYGPSGYGYVNGVSNTYVAWCWDESATPGFDIVTYTGNNTNRTIAHSLGVAPSMMIVKNRSAATGWIVYHKFANASPATGGLRLNLTDGFITYSLYWNNTEPTSSVFTVGAENQVNGNTDQMVAYLWSEVAGFSKFGSYTGNGSSDGPFVFTGFRPRWLMIKVTSISGNSWVMLDSAREPTNDDSQLYLNAESSAAEADSPAVNGYPHFFSNGFKLRGSSNGVNGSGQTYIFAAFAESPFKYSLAR